MTVEAELAQLLIRMGTERGLDIEAVLSEMAQSPLPSFVDANAVRGSMLEAVESWWRADLEERLGQLRRQFQIDTASPPIVARSNPTPPSVPSAPPSRSAPVESSTQIASEPVLLVDGATVYDMPENGPNEPGEALPRDATMIWNTNHG